MTIYTEKAFDKLNKKELIIIILSLQSKVESANNKIFDQVRQLNQKFSQLEAENKVVKQANWLLSKRLVDMESKCWVNAQYSRRECLEMAGIPDSVQNDELEDKVLTIFKKIGREVCPRDIEASYCLKKDNDRLIVKFSRRKDCEQIISVKKDLKHLKLQKVGLQGNRTIFINTSLCHYYRMLWSKCKELHDLGKISNFYISSGTIKVKITENRNPISITHTEDFVKYYPEVDLLQSNYQSIPNTNHLLPTNQNLFLCRLYMPLLDFFSLLVSPWGPSLYNCFSITKPSFILSSISFYERLCSILRVLFKIIAVMKPVNK